eukprot:COSAG06_NODE_2531_length_6712_cov_3.173446_2_plen_75_part_00
MVAGWLARWLAGALARWHTVDVDRVPAALDGGACGRAKLEGIVPVELHARAHELVHVRGARNLVVAASRLGVPP